jgi:uncharacterized protein (TIGR04222 family)
MHRSASGRPDTSDLDPYAAAMLNGGRPIAVNAALANLVHRGSIAVDASNGILTAVSEPDANAPAIEKATNRPEQLTNG